MMSARNGGRKPNAFDILMNGVDANGGIGRPITNGWPATPVPVVLVAVGVVVSAVVAGGFVPLGLGPDGEGEVGGKVVQAAAANTIAKRIVRVTVGRCIRRIVRSSLTDCEAEFL